jgi:hypothetical protein
VEFWSERAIILAITGLACVIVSLVAGALLADRPTGPFVPAHEENGRIVPGRFK